MSSKSSSRDRILEATEALIGERGAEVSMAEVARAAGVSRQAVYMHFSSRSGLLVAVVRRMDERSGVVTRCAAALEREEPVDALRCFLAIWVRYVATIQPVASALLAARGADEAAASAWEDRMAQLRAGHGRAAERLAAAGLLREDLAPEVAADLAWAMSSVPVWEQLAVDRGWPKRRVEDALVAAVVAAICRC